MSNVKREHINKRDFHLAYPINSEATNQLLKKHEDVFQNPQELAKQLLYACMAINKSGIGDFVPESSVRWGGCYSHFTRDKGDLKVISDMINNIRNDGKKDYKEEIWNIMKNNNSTHHSVGSFGEGVFINRAPHIFRSFAAMASMLMDLNDNSKIKLTENAKKALEVISAFPDIYTSDPDCIKDKNPELWDSKITSAMKKYYNEVIDDKLKPGKIGIGNYVEQVLNRTKTFGLHSHRLPGENRSKNGESTFIRI